MFSVRERYANLSDENLSEIIGEISTSDPNLGASEIVAHLRDRNPPIQIQRYQCAKILAQSHLVYTTNIWALSAIGASWCSVPTLHP